jgi:hypothetical protein
VLVVIEMRDSRNIYHPKWSEEVDAGEHWELKDLSGALYLGFASDSVGRCSPHQHNNGVYKYVGPRLISSVESRTAAPTSYLLIQNYPNPFNPTTTIRYELPKSSMVTLSVYDLLGREVSVLVSESENAGSYEVKFDARGLGTGVYIYRLTAGSFVQTCRMLLLK